MFAWLKKLRSKKRYIYDNKKSLMVKTPYGDLKLPSSARRDLKRYYELQLENKLRKAEISSSELDLEEAELEADLKDLEGGDEGGEIQQLISGFIGGAINAKSNTAGHTGRDKKGLLGSDPQAREDRKED